MLVSATAREQMPFCKYSSMLMPRPTALQAWHGPFMKHQQHKRTQLAAAAAHCTAQQQRQALHRWQANAAAAQQERLAMQLVTRHMQMQLLSRAMAGWAAACAEAAAERQQLADAAAPAVQVLAGLKLWRVVAAWRLLVTQQQQEREAVSVFC
jgi:hypothetical protein